MERHALAVSSIMNGILWLAVQLLFQRMAANGSGVMSLSDGLVDYALFLTGGAMVVVGVCRILMDEFF